MKPETPITAQWSEYHGRFTLSDANDNYFATVQVYQTPRLMGQVDEPQRREACRMIVEAVNGFESVKAENAKLREALKHFKVDLTTLSGSGHAYTVLATGQKQLREALG